VCVLCGSPVWPSPPVVGPLWGPPLCVGPLWVGSPSCRVLVPCGIYSRDVSRSCTRSRTDTSRAWMQKKRPKYACSVYTYNATTPFAEEDMPVPNASSRCHIHPNIVSGFPRHCITAALFRTVARSPCFQPWFESRLGTFPLVCLCHCLYRSQSLL